MKKNYIEIIIYMHTFEFTYKGINWPLSDYLAFVPNLRATWIKSLSRQIYQRKYLSNAYFRNIKFIFLQTQLCVVISITGFFLVKDPPTAPLPPPQKEPFWFFGPNSWEMFWNEWKTKNKIPIYFFRFDRFCS